jgi:hypothetical protein
MQLLNLQTSQQLVVTPETPVGPQAVGVLGDLIYAPITPSKSSGETRGVRRALPSRKSVLGQSHAKGENSSSGSSRATEITDRRHMYAQS